MAEKNKKISIVDSLKERAEYAKASVESGLINEDTGSSILIDRAGNTTIAASKTVQYKLHYANGHATEISTASNTITNRKNIIADEILVNKHKLNHQLYELTDMKKFLNDPTQAIGNLTMNGTVLVKAWEPNLKKWVLIRRPIRTPIFSNLMNLPHVPESMDINDNISDYIEAMRKTEELY